MNRRHGFALLGVLITFAIIAVLATISFRYYFGTGPGSLTVPIVGGKQAGVGAAQLPASGRDMQRWDHVRAIADAVVRFVIDHDGVFACGGAPTSTVMIGSGPGNRDLGACLVSAYLPAMPLDPSTGTPAATGYVFSYDASGGHVTVSAPGGELDKAITITR